LYDSEKDKRYVGTFDGWLISKGKYYKKDRLVYEGSFSSVALKDDGKSLWYKFGTMYFDDHSFTGYFKDNQPFGEGIITPIDNRIPVSIINSCLNLDLVIEGETVHTLNKISERILFPAGKRISLKVSDINDLLRKYIEDRFFYDVPREKSNDYLDWDIDTLFEQTLSKLCVDVQNATLKDGIHDGWQYSGMVNALMTPHGEGVIIDTRGIQFKGTFKNGKREGQFEIIYPDGNKEVATFTDDKY
jgi:hypothetical protein